MPNIPLWLTGKNVTAATITPQTVGSDGALTDTTGVPLYGHLDEVGIRGRIEAEEISPMDTSRLNMVPIKAGTTITLTEILKGGNLANLLAAVYYGASVYVKIALSRGGQSFVFYGLAVDYDESLRRGRSVGTMVVDMVDPLTANPTYTGGT